MATYIVKDISFNATYECPDDTYILDQAEAHGLDYPYSDRAGASSSSVAFLLAGSVFDEGTFLSEEERKMGFFHTDSSYPTSNIEIATLGIEELLGAWGDEPDKWIFPGRDI